MSARPVRPAAILAALLGAGTLAVAGCGATPSPTAPTTQALAASPTPPTSPADPASGCTPGSGDLVLRQGRPYPLSTSGPYRVAIGSFGSGTTPTVTLVLMGGATGAPADQAPDGSYTSHRTVGVGETFTFMGIAVAVRCVDRSMVVLRLL